MPARCTTAPRVTSSIATKTVDQGCTGVSVTGVSLNDISLTTLGGAPTSLADYADRAVLIVNVASKCGLTPQYGALEQLARDYGDRGLTVLGVPCNQFMGQEPGTAEEIETFCSTTYGVTFPLLAKTDVNGPERHPLYAELTEAADADGAGRRRAMELREVSRRTGRRGGQSVPAADGSRRPRGGGGAIEGRASSHLDCPARPGHLPSGCLTPSRHLRLVTLLAWLGN